MRFTAPDDSQLEPVFLIKAVRLTHLSARILRVRPFQTYPHLALGHLFLSGASLASADAAYWTVF